VASATGGAQQPWVSLSPIKGDFYFTPKSASTGGRLELALVAEDPAKASGPPLHDYGDANTTYGIERDITLPGDIESFAATTIDLDATTRTPAINIVLAAPAVDRINRGANLVDRRIALVLDGRTVLSVAVLRVPFLPKNLQLTGNFSLNDVSRLVDTISDNP
jgi:preprotein translocase subunit SecD